MSPKTPAPAAGAHPSGYVPLDAAAAPSEIHPIPLASRPLSTAVSTAPKKRAHTGTEKKRKKEGDGPESAEKKVQVSSCDTCKEGHRKCNGLEPCMSCEAANIRCTYDTLSATKKKAHDAYVLMKKQEQAQRLKSADVIVAPLGQLQIVGNNSNFGPILFQVMNFPRYEPPTSDIRRDEPLKIGCLEELLIDCYFDHFNYYIPVLNRKAFMEQVRDPEQLATIGVQKLLACVLATGSAFFQDWSDPDPSKRHPMYGATMCRKFNELNIHDVFNSSIENCQCYLILIGYYSSTTAHDKVHNLVALAHSTAASQGLNRNKGLYYQMPYKGNRGHTADTIEMGHRVYWSVVMVCSVFSHDHQAPFITSNDHDISFPQRQPSDKSCDFQGHERDDFDGIKHLGYFVPMYEIISRIADITNTGTKQRPHTAVDEAREELQKWRAKTLPPELRITSPTDMDALQKQTMFSKFNLAISYVFEICLHQTFQLHESHRERGLHGLWCRYGFEAAVGIKNIYSMRPFIRMNAHIILTIAAGAFSTAIVNNISGKVEAAHRYRDEIMETLADIMGSSSNADADKTNRRYAGVVKNGVVKTEASLNMDTTDPSPLNGNSPSQTSGSSPTHTTDVTADTDIYSSDEDMGNDRGSDMEDDMGHNKRSSGHFAHLSGQRFSHQNQSDLSRRQSHPHSKSLQNRGHPSMQARTKSSPNILPNRQGFDHKQQQHKQQQRLPQQQSTTDGPGYGSMMPGTTSGNSSTLVSPTFPPQYGGANNDNFSSASRPHIHHRTSSNPSQPAFSSDAPRMTSDAGFANSHGMTGDQDTYIASRIHQGARPQLQHQQSFSSGQHPIGDEPSRPHQNSVSSTTSASSVFTNSALVHDMEGGSRELTQSPWPKQLNDAQMMMLQESNSVVGLDRLSLQDQHRLHNETRQRMMDFESAPPTTSSSHPNGGHNDQEQFNIHSHQQSTYNEMEIPVAASLNSSRLLKGEFDGSGLMAGIPLGFGSMPDDTVQDGQRFCQPMLMFSMTNKVSDHSEQSSPGSPPSSQQQHQASMTTSSQAGSSSSMLGILMEQQHNTDQDLTSQSLMSPLVYGSLQDESLLGHSFGTGMGSLGLLTTGDSEFGLHGDNISTFFDDPRLAEQQKIFSSIASKTMQPPPQPQPQPQHHQQRQQPPQQHHHYQHHHPPSQTLAHRPHLQHQRPLSFQYQGHQGRVIT